MEPCEGSPIANICFQRSVLFYAIDIELCGNEKASDCLKERIEYWEKISNFSESYANTPGLGRATLNACKPFFVVKPKSDRLKKIQTLISQTSPGMEIYTEIENITNA